MAHQHRLRGNEAVFTINGNICRVSVEIPGTTSLITFIREHANLYGTKYMCLEGGCGVCLVTLKFPDPVTRIQKIISVNSCLFPVLSCHGMAITTIEGIGNRKTGYNSIQTKLAFFNGSQCGFCSPGMVMNMYSLKKANPNITTSEIENSFDGNLCRCTGYRPILDAAKTLTINVPTELSQKVSDIEDFLSNCRHNEKCKRCCCKNSFCVKKEEDEDYETDFLEISLAETSLCINLNDGTKWYKAANVQEVFQILQMSSGRYHLINGNTSKGVYKYIPPPNVFIDISSIVQLKKHTFDGTNLSVGANMTLADTIKLFNAVAQEQPQSMGYLCILADHIKKVANTPVRNVGTLAGNLSIKHQHNEFPSDLFTIFEGVGAVVNIESGDGNPDQLMPLLMYLRSNMNKKVMTSINFQPYDQSYVIKTYKITPRAQNAIADINACFRFKFDPSNNFKVLERPSIVFGGINKSFVHASRTESFLTNKYLMDNKTLQISLLILESEVQPDNVLPLASPAYRKGLTQSVFYKFVLSLFPAGVKAKYQSGSEDLTRPISSGMQDYATNPSIYPINQPVLKLEALSQCSGEVHYTFDKPILKEDLFGELVLANQGAAVIDKIDISKAMKIPGVIKFFSSKDIPGKNSFTATFPLLIPDEEELFVTTYVTYAGQPVGIIVAKSKAIASQAARAVVITYKSKSKPLLDVEEIVKSGDKSKLIFQGKLEPTATKTDVQHTIKGDIKLGGQSHFTTETLGCYTVPFDAGLDVYCTTQWIQCTQEAIALALNIPENSLNIRVARCGGGFGLKLTRANVVTVACSLAAYLLGQPVRLFSTLENTMEAVGKRYSVYSDYEVKVNKVGQIQSLILNLYLDAGSSNNDPVIPNITILAIGNIYDYSTWKVTGYNVKTNKPSNTWMRAPGTTEAVTIVENIMEHIAKVMDLDPWKVRLNNIIPGKYPVDEMIAELKRKADYDNRLRAVKTFNSVNVWKKKGISLLFVRHPLPYLGNYNCMISIYRKDGTVALVHGGIEIGQGINTKAVQTCARELGIPISFISVKTSNNLTSPNNFFTGNSATSESVCLGVIKCCEILNERLEAVRKKLTNPTWKELISQAYIDKIDLNASAMMSPLDKVSQYDIFGVAIMECKIDILTGEHIKLRADILQDSGRSINPLLDVGQVEGAFVMGLGYCTSEKLLYDPQTGELKTNRTWNYKIPGAKDIPIIFNVHLLKNSSNPSGVLSAKAVAEAPLCLAISILHATRYAVQSARKDLGFPDTWISSFDPPYTAENIFLTAKASRTKYLL